MSNTPADQDNFQSLSSGLFGQKKRGIAFTLRIGLLCMAGVAIFIAILTTTIFGVLSSNFDSISRDVIPTTEEALRLTDLARSIDSSARDLPSMHETFGIASTAYQLRQLRNELAAAIERLGPSLMKSKDLDAVRNSIDIMNSQLEHLISIVQQRNAAEMLQKAHIKTLEGIYRDTESLGMKLAESQDKFSKWGPLFMAMIRGTELLIATLVMEDPKNVIENQQMFKEQVKIIESNINLGDTHLQPQIGHLSKRMLQYQTLFDEKLQQIQLGLHIQTAIKSLAVMDRLIGQVGNLSARINNAAKTNANEMNRISIQLRWVFGLITLICVAGLGGLLVFINRRIVKRMQNLQTGMLSHVAGKALPIPTSGSDEISDMAHSFLFYVDETDKREERIQERTRELNSTLAEQKEMEAELRKNQKNLELTLSDLHNKNAELESSTEEIRKAKEISEQSAKALHDHIEELAGARRAMLNIMKDLDEAKKEAESATQTKSDFLANMSHEIRTPMNAVLGFLELVLEDPSLLELQRKHLTTAQISANSLLGVINDILDISKLESGKLTVEQHPFNLLRLMQQIHETMDIQAREKGLELKLDIYPSVSRAFVGDPLRLRQIMINLVGNAVKFTKEGGVFMRIMPAEEEGQLHFMIEDTGIGIPDDRLSQIFEQFTQADTSTTRQFGGTGLGTTTARDLVELMGGRIWVESEEGKGSTFHFLINLIPTDQVPEEADLFVIPGKAAFPSARCCFRILLVEDVEANVELAKIRLEQQGHEVTVAWNGSEAIEAFAPGEIDVILMDIQMPKMGGIEASERIRALEADTGGHVPIIAMTAGVTKDETERYFEAGMDAFVAKPINFGKLFKTMEDVVPEGVGEMVAQVQEDVRPPPEIELPPLDGIDIKKGLQTWQNSEAYAKALLGFSHDYGNAAADLSRLIDEGDMDSAFHMAHTLKGVAGNLSVTEVANATINIDVALREKRIDDVKDQLPTLAAALNTAVDSIRQLEAVQDVEEVPKKEMDVSYLTELFIKMLAAFDQFNPYVIQPFLSELKEYLAQDQLNSIVKHMERFDFDGAKQETVKLAETLRIDLEG